MPPSTIEFYDEFDIKSHPDRAEFSHLSLILRKCDNFQNVEQAHLYPGNLQVLRLLSLLIFEGDRLKTNEPSPAVKSISTASFDEEDILLYDSAISEPYLLFALDETLPFSEQTLIANVLLNVTQPVILSRSTLSNCAHSIKNSFCLKCHYGYVLDSQQECVACASADLHNSSLDQCVTLDDQTTLELEMNLVNRFDYFVDSDFYNTGKIPTFSAAVFSMFDSGNDASLENLFHYNMLNLAGDNRILVYSIKLHFEISFEENFVSNVIGLFAGNWKGDSFIFQTQLEVTQVSSSEITFMTNFTFFNMVESEASLIIERLGIFLTNSIEFDFQTFYSYINVSPIPLTDFIDKLSKTSSDLPGHSHSVSFPLETSIEKNVFVASRIYQYDSVTSIPDDSKILLQKYIDANELCFYLRSCQVNCLKCSSFFDCTECSDGFFLSHGQCHECSPDCETCVDHAQKCKTCSTDPNNVLSGRWLVRFNPRLANWQLCDL